jgi:hypothetical protein
MKVISTTVFETSNGKLFKEEHDAIEEEYVEFLIKIFQNEGIMPVNTRDFARQFVDVGFAEELRNGLNWYVDAKNNARV